MNWGVVVFPGSNCDDDAHDALARIFGQPVRMIWHRETSLGDLDAILLPGGFSYGDYLRGGAIARFSPVMEDVVRFARDGGVVIGICNGFQILTEAGLLPGALLRNRSLRFICRDQPVRVERHDTRFTNACDPGRVLHIPIAHNEGAYYLPGDQLARLEDRGAVVLRYCAPDGTVSGEHNPNGSVNNIAGIVNEAGNVLGMMPHPERCCDAAIGHTDGRLIFESVISSFVAA
ncbi:MAG: Phosphoribosylformylglycinamidine synthase subunit PurQ [Calditrichaeota bacterium]|nr:Phosphoribosylformylglycinamidine synthase subunit PurQ [Calditrichota bacterium]